MPKTISLSMRRSMYAPVSSDFTILLVTIDHPDIVDGPLYISSDPTQIFTREPLVFGTVSNGIKYLFLFVSGQAPDEEEGTPRGTTLIFETVTSDLIKEARSTIEQATVTLALVSPAAPDFVEESFTQLKAVLARYDANTLSLEISRDDFTAQACPYHRMSTSRFKSLFR
jgi:hypothetical protein